MTGSTDNAIASPCGANDGGANPAATERGAALGRDPIGRPRLGEADLDRHVVGELAQPLGHRRAHDLDRRAADERWQQLHADAARASVSTERTTPRSTTEIVRDLRIVDVIQRGPDGRLQRAGRHRRSYHSTPSSSRATDVNSPHSQRKDSEGTAWSRPSAGGRPSGEAAQAKLVQTTIAHSDRQLISDARTSVRPARPPRPAALRRGAA